jgi:hypothetical protein
VDTEGTETEAVFLGPDDTVAVFSNVESLARYCRTAKEHRLVKLEWWSELAEQDDDELFAPADDAVYDLRKPSTPGADLLRELVAFCDLDADTTVLDGPSIDRDDWAELVSEVRTCLQPQD